MKTIAYRAESATRPWAIASVLAAFLCLAGCAADTTNQAVPPATGTAAAAPAGSVGTGQYPNLNLPRKGATAQFTPAEQTGNINALASARQGNESATPPDTAAIGADSATLSKLGQTEPNDVLKQIESGQQ